MKNDVYCFEAKLMNEAAGDMDIEKEDPDHASRQWEALYGELNRLVKEERQKLVSLSLQHSTKSKTTENKKETTIVNTYAHSDNVRFKTISPSRNFEIVCADDNNTSYHIVNLGFSDWATQTVNENMSRLVVQYDNSIAFVLTFESL